MTSVPAAVSNFIQQDASNIIIASTKFRSSVKLFLLAKNWVIRSISIRLFKSSLPLSECGLITITEVGSLYIL